MTPLQRLGEDIRKHGRQCNRPAAHGTGIIDQERNNGVVDLVVPLLFVGQRTGGINHQPGQARGIQQAVIQVKGPRSFL